MLIGRERRKLSPSQSPLHLIEMSSYSRYGEAMPVLQVNALTLNPNAVAMTLVATYRRRVHASLERVWENVLDWEHLPHLHDTSFDYCSLDEAGLWGWRVWSAPDKSSHIELCVDADQYVARTYAGSDQQSEIWTKLDAVDERATDIEVSFYLSGVPEEKVGQLGEAMLRLYTRLWDEDESMMQERQRRLDQRPGREQEKIIGKTAELASHLPVTFEFDRQQYELRFDQSWRLRPLICPHLLGPLEPSEQSDSILRCLWHGYEFDVESGACLSPSTATCKLKPLPLIEERDGALWVVSA